MQLVSPSVEYKESFLAAIREFQVEGHYSEMSVAEAEGDFPAYLAKFEKESKGEGLPEGIVPQTTFWLVDKGEFIGRVSVRHRLNEKLEQIGGHIGYNIRPTKRRMGYGTKILELVLPFVKSLGIVKALLTCNDDNVGSAKIIEAQGGVLENKLQTEEGLKRRYWITLS